MTVLTQILNGSLMKNVRDTLNDLITKEASGGRLNQAGVEALPAAAPADVPGSGLALLGVADNGALKKFTTNLFPARKTADVSVLPGSEFAEYLMCLSSTGLERRIAVSALTRTVGEIIDPSLPPYNVRFDFQKAKPVSMAAGTNLVTSAEQGVFQAPRDIGKLIAVSGVGPSDNVYTGYIGQVVDGQTVRVFTTPSLATPALATTTRYAEEAMWGTDSTAGMQAALDAAEPPGSNSYATGQVVLLSGICCVTHLRFGSVSIVGLARTNCGFAALPTNSFGTPILFDKQDGRYAQYKPANYTLKDFSILGQRYTSRPGTFRPNLVIIGGSFYEFLRGAPYATVDGINSTDSITHGIYTRGAFAGQMNNISAGGNGQCGIVSGFWDLNGVNWHTEGNGCAGVYSMMPGANVSMVRSSYNGTNPWGHPIEWGCNLCEVGNGNTWTNVRMQESWANNLVLSSYSPLGDLASGTRNKFVFATFDDTGNIVPLQKKGSGWWNPALPNVRAMIRLRGAQVWGNEIDFVSGSGQVFANQNVATHGVYAGNGAHDNLVTLNTPGISNALTSWYPGGLSTETDGTPIANDTVAVSHGPWGTDTGAALTTAGNVVTVNRVQAP